MTLYKNKYRIESARLPGWDYSSDGYYFITICTKNRDCLFGEIISGIMILNKIGTIVEQEWNKSFKIRSELMCDCYAIMPNHIHGIVVIENNHCGNHNNHGGNKNNHGGNKNNDGGDARPCVSTDLGNARMPKSVSSFVAGFKSSATKQINEMRNTPGLPVWQPRFHDRIVRDENELNRIRKYIINNPAKWDIDGLHYHGI